MKTATNDVSQLFDLLHQNVQSFLQSDKYRQYLTTMSRFHRYSARNSLLILLQNPDASYVAGFQHWKNAFQRFLYARANMVFRLLDTALRKSV